MAHHQQLPANQREPYSSRSLMSLRVYETRTGAMMKRYALSVGLASMMSYSIADRALVLLL